MSRLVYATRRSALALAQSRAFVAQLKSAHPQLELAEEQVVTTGDRIIDVPLADIGGKGLFVKEIEEALLEHRADIAVHSIKDVPALLPDRLHIACIPKREDPRDALVSPRYGSLAQLPEGATVGTSSLRRAAAIRAVRPDVRIVPLRGNVDTRLRKVDAGDVDAIVLAHAGLLRLGLQARVTELLSTDVSLPAVGQGALGIEARSDDIATSKLLASVAHLETQRAVLAERGVLEALGADCKTPLGAYAEQLPPQGGSVPRLLMRLRAFVCKPHIVRHEVVVPWPESDEAAKNIGADVGAVLLG